MADQQQKKSITTSTSKDQASAHDKNSNPHDSLETQILAIWEELLGVSNININDDFIELGGDSLVAIRIANRIKSTFGIRISGLDIMDLSTIPNLINNLKKQYPVTGC
jgi:acyl carrier protein